MKTSLPPSMAFPLPAPVTPVQPVSAASAAARAGSQQALPLPLHLSSNPLRHEHGDDEHDEHGGHEAKGQRKGAVAFRSPRPNAQRSNPPPKLAQSRPAQVRSRPTGPASAPVSADGVVSNPSAETDIDDLGDDFESRRAKLGYSMRVNTANHQEGERGGTDEGGHQERQFKTIRMASVIKLLRAEPSPAVEKALQSLLTASSIEALARPLRSLVRDVDALGDAAPLQSLVFRAAKSWLQRQAASSSGTTGGSTSLGEIRAALVESGDRAPASVSEQQAAAHLWLPMYLLNLDRPRTPRQRQQAIERLDMIERRLAASAQRRTE